VELRQLRYFVTVAELLNFHKAAERLHVTQSSISRQVQQLEQELGTALLIRGQKDVRLTGDGRLVLSKARTVLAAVGDLAGIVNQPNQRTYTLKVGVGVPLAKSIQPLVTKFARQFPNVDVQYEDILLPETQNGALRRGDIDVGIFWPPIDRLHINSERLFDERFRVILPAANPLARRKKLRFKDLSNEVLLLPDQIRANNRSVLQGAHEAGVALKTSRTTALPHEAGAALVASGRGIYVLAGNPTRFPNFGTGIVAIPLDEPMSLEVYLTWRKGETNAAACHFVETARRILTRLPTTV